MPSIHTGVVSAGRRNRACGWLGWGQMDGDKHDRWMEVTNSMKVRRVESSSMKKTATIGHWSHSEHVSFRAGSPFFEPSERRTHASSAAVTMSGAEYTESMSLPADAPPDAFHFLKRYDTLGDFVADVQKPGNVRVDAVPPTEDADGEVVFDVVGVDCSVANALRRIILDDVETMAIERVMFHQNTGIMQDEKLAHRLGLIPILADPAKFGPRPEISGEPHATENDTLVFELEVRCFDHDLDHTDPTNRSKTIYSRDLKWVPQGSQVSSPFFSHWSQRCVSILSLAVGVVYERHCLCPWVCQLAIDFRVCCVTPHALFREPAGTLPWLRATAIPRRHHCDATWGGAANQGNMFCTEGLRPRALQVAASHGLLPPTADRPVAEALSLIHI